MMDASQHNRPSPTLLGRLRQAPNDPTAWREFVERYGPIHYPRCRHWGLTNANAEDVSQNVMVDLAHQMKDFEYRETGRLRAWLKTIVHRAWCDSCESRQHHPQGTGAIVRLRVEPVGSLHAHGVGE